MREVEQDVPMRFAEALAIECIVADAFNFFFGRDGHVAIKTGSIITTIINGGGYHHKNTDTKNHTVKLADTRAFDNTSSSSSSTARGS